MAQQFSPCVAPTARLLFAAALISLFACGPRAAADTDWTGFVASPTKERLEALEGIVGACHGDLKCRQSKRPTSQELGGLVQLVESGNSEALAAGFLALRTMSFAGGDQGDLLRALGGQIKASATRFLALVGVYGRDPDLLTMLPLETTDDVALKVSEIDRRIEALKTVADPAVKGDRDWALGVLTEYRSTFSAPK